MDKAVELIVSWMHKNIKNPKLYAAIAVLIIIIALIFPYVDANYFFYTRVEKRINILHSLSEIDAEKLANSPVLKDEYDSILSEIQKQREWAFSGATSSGQPLFKVLSGGALSWGIMLCVPFMTSQNKKEKVLVFVFLAVFGGILGGVGYILPIVLNPWINYIGYPILQIILLFACFSS